MSELKAEYLGYAPYSCELNFKCPTCGKKFSLKFKDHFGECNCPSCNSKLRTGF